MDDKSVEPHGTPSSVMYALLMVTGVLMRNGAISPEDIIKTAESWALERQRDGSQPESVWGILELRALAIALDKVDRLERGAGPALTIIPGGREN